MFFANAGAKIVQTKRNTKFIWKFLKLSPSSACKTCQRQCQPNKNATPAAYFPSFTETNLAFATPNLSTRSSCIGRWRSSSVV